MEKYNIFKKVRISADLTQEEVAEELGISSDKLSRIENEKIIPSPDLVVDLASTYKCPMLPNYYCSHICDIGKNRLEQEEEPSVSQSLIKLLVGLNKLEEDKNRLMEIVSDEKIDNHEMNDFVQIKDSLEKMDASIKELNIWADKMMNEDEKRK